MRASPLRLLIVEDERIIALALELLVRKMGHSVAACVATGEAALEAVRDLKPDLVLMDIHLEGELDGIETARLLREQGGPPLAYATAYTDPETRARALPTEPLAFLPKPVSPADMQRLVDMVANRA